MTLASQTDPVSCATLDDAVALLRERGFRLSTSRRLVLEALFATDQPVTAEHIATRLKLDLTSVYRNLEVLEQQGLVRHVHLGHGPGLYALVAHGEREYLYCERCHAVTAVAPEELAAVRDQIRDRFGYEVRFTHFPITGRCAACGVNPPQPPSAPR
jgi:Fur family transcriptional regulator, ferric uptake regulator